jgi:hypothetical protein
VVQSVVPEQKSQRLERSPPKGRALFHKEPVWKRRLRNLKSSLNEQAADFAKVKLLTLGNFNLVTCGFIKVYLFDDQA